MRRCGGAKRPQLQPAGILANPATLKLSADEKPADEKPSQIQFLQEPSFKDIESFFDITL